MTFLSAVYLAASSVDSEDFPNQRTDILSVKKQRIRSPQVDLDYAPNSQK
jgi:hypothetical protein